MIESELFCEKQIIHKEENFDYSRSSISTMCNDLYFSGYWENEKVFGVIYTVINKINKKIYVGQTRKGFEYRKNLHIKSIGKIRNHFYHALNKYGVDNFIWKVIDVTYSKKELDNKERWWINMLATTNPDFGYNISEGGHGGKTHEGPIHSEEQKKKWSEDRLNKTWEESWGVDTAKEVRKKASARMSGDNNVSKRKEVRTKISKTLKRKHANGEIVITDETRKKLATAKGKVWITNGEEEILILKENSNIEGWIRGRSNTIKNNLKEKGKFFNSCKGYIWINNSTINKRVFSNMLDDYINKGWKRGILRHG